MNPWALLGLSAAFLFGPWALMTARGPLPELHGWLRPLWWLNAMFCAVWHGLDLDPSGKAPLPAEGPAILIANHTCGLDPFLLQASCERLLGFMIAKEFYESRLIHPICRMLGCIPVRRDGHDLSAMRGALRGLKEGRVVPIFPEGRILPTSGLELGEPKSGAAFLVLHARVPVVPAYLSGTPPTRTIWKAILTPSNSRVVYGPPIDLSDLPSEPPYDKDLLAEVAQRLMAAIRALRDGHERRPGPESRPEPVSGDRPAVRTA